LSLQARRDVDRESQPNPPTNSLSTGLELAIGFFLFTGLSSHSCWLGRWQTG